jgi:D-alanyl-lipoteichoic acid acyltransferase DltB (MBOAT superfamily)
MFFLLAILVVYWSLKTKIHQNIFLLIASYLFYASWDWRFLFLIIFSTWIDYFAGRRIYDSTNPKKRKFYLLLSIVTNLSLLGFFKYYNFFIESLNSVLSFMGFYPNLSTLSIILPLGISFYTFQSMSYTLDIYRRQIEPVDSFMPFALYVSFFPQLIAGPIERARHLLTQINEDRRFDIAQFLDGIMLILWGLVKKIVIADNIAYYVNMIFDLRAPSTLLILVGTFGFGIQVFSDFSAYTDLARGSAKLMGFELVKNFNNPYLASSPPDFWRRWHISLSSWVKDYIFIPLGGSRCSLKRYVFNVLVVWSLMGLWHGAAWHYVVFGLYHALLIILYKLIIKPLIKPDFFEKRFLKYIPIFITYLLINIGFVLFRTTSLGNLGIYFNMAALRQSKFDLNVAYILICIFLFYSLPYLAVTVFSKYINKIKSNASNFVNFLLFNAVVASLLITIFARSNTNDFVYFQF